VKKLLAVSIIFAMTLVFTQTGCSQTSDELKPIIEEMKVLKKGQEDIRKELQEVKKLLQGKAAPRRAAPEFKEAIINMADDPFKGNKSARVVVFEFSDYQ
jgi:hypothetical protein